MKNFTFILFLMLVLSAIGCSSGDPEAWKYYLPKLENGQTVSLTFVTYPSNNDKVPLIDKYTRIDASTFQLQKDIGELYSEFKIKNNKVVLTKLKSIILRESEPNEIVWPSKIIEGKLLNIDNEQKYKVIKKDIPVTTPFGQLENCIQIEAIETGIPTMSNVYSWYCKNYGLVKLTAMKEGKEGGFVLQSIK